MGKKVINNLTKKDGNKLGKRKRERTWLNIEFKNRMTPLDIKAFANDILTSTGERNERLILPSFAGKLSKVIGMDHGIPAGDFATIGAIAYHPEDNMFKSNTHALMVLHAMKHDTPIFSIDLEDGYENTIGKVLNHAKEKEYPILQQPFLLENNGEFYQQIRKFTNDNNHDDHHAIWCGPMMDNSPLPINGFSNKHGMDAEKVFYRARELAKNMGHISVIPAKEPDISISEFVMNNIKARKEYKEKHKEDELMMFDYKQTLNINRDYGSMGSIPLYNENLASSITEFSKKLSKYKFDNMFSRDDGVLISLDWDDVMYHLMQKNIEFVEKEYNVKDVHLEITNYYYLYNTYPKIADMLWNHPENYISGELIDGALEFYYKLVELVGENAIQIVTSSMENVIPLKDKMIKERFGINCRIVHSVFGKHRKHDYTKDTILIDDHVGNIKDHINHNFTYGIIFNHMGLEYIKNAHEEYPVRYAETYDEVIKQIKKILVIGDKDDN